MDPSEPADPSDLSLPDPSDLSLPDPPTAGGRGAWITLGALGLLLVVTVTLTLTGGPVDGSSGASGRAITTASTAATDGPCTAAVTEPLDPNSVLRLLPNAPRPEYASNPPTSGAFQVGPQVPAVSGVELSAPVQVGLLAEGKVLIQYRDLSDAVLSALQSMADGETVIVAPNPSLPSPIVATAWRTRQECSGFNAEVLGRFVTLNADRGPQAGPNGTSPPTTE